MASSGPEVNRVPADPGDNTCHVWLADVSLERPAHLGLLSDVEKARRDGYVRAQDRAQFTLAAALLRLLASMDSGERPADVMVDRSCLRCVKPHGRPRIPGTDLHVSVSHAQGQVSVATTKVAPIGLDIEEIRVRDVDALARACLSPDEPVRRPEDFFTYWCRKESAVKATGDGLYAPMTQVVVSAADEPPRLISYLGAQLPATMADIALARQYAGAVTVLAEIELDVVVRDAAQILAA